jgi:secondary thiamine-phosphate synthase enzyme
MKELSVRSRDRTELVDVTSLVAEAVAGESGSLVTVFVPHTTAGIVVQAAGPGATAVAGDVAAALDRLVDERGPWEHTREGDRNPWAHVRAALTASSVSIPLVDGELMLGAHQAIFLAEFDGPRERTLRVTVT